ncbi:MAG: hypothetical protein NTZ17_03710 [Phycisphaerae bacterium]|nr:hypothetical protein [Phycisphaerae bacterium]
MKKLPYVNPDRLADVMALIQVLALHKYSHRSDKELTDEMQGPPRSASAWKEIAQQHPEFFRVNDEERLGVSLVSRHVLPKDENGTRELPSDFASMLLQTAIGLHDRQVDLANRWKAYIPIVVAVIAGALTTLNIFLTSWLRKP